MKLYQPKPMLVDTWQPEEIRDKVIFLDVDGVLNCQETENVYHGFIFLEEEKVELLKAIVEATQAQIVLSSTWRGDYYWKQQGGVKQTYNLFELLRAELASRGMYISDMTADIWQARGIEIKDYLDEHPQIKHIAILDDDNCMPLSKYHVKTSWRYGLLPEHYQQAIDTIKMDYCMDNDYIVKEDKIGDQYFTYYKSGVVVQGTTSLFDDVKDI